MTEIYKPVAGLRNHQFEGVEDICDLAEVMRLAKQERREGAMH